MSSQSVYLRGHDVPIFPFLDATSQSSNTFHYIFIKFDSAIYQGSEVFQDNYTLLNKVVNCRSIGL